MENVGSNGHIEQPKSILKNFTKRKKFGTNDKDFNTGKELDNLDTYGKCIIRTINLIDMSDIHKGNTNNCKKIIYPMEFTEKSLDESPIHLNHYAIQSKNWLKLDEEMQLMLKMPEMMIIIDNELSNKSI